MDIFNMKGQIIGIIILTSILLGYNFCSNPAKELNRVVAKWTGKTIRFPEGIRCVSMGKDTACQEKKDKVFTILMYADSTGCASCRFHPYEWQKLIEEADTIFPGILDFKFYFYPKSETELNLIFQRERFYYPVHMDNNDELNKLNRFPRDLRFQCFLLNKNNKVIGIGNPYTNREIWKLYKHIIFENLK